MPVFDNINVFNQKYEKCLSLYANNYYLEGLQILFELWDMIPDNKYEYSESFLVSWRIIEGAVATNDSELANNWKIHIANAAPHRLDTGHRDLLLGKIAYLNKSFSEALSFFNIANKKSHGRCFGAKDSIYKEFLLSGGKCISNENLTTVTTAELDDKQYEKITKLCDQGNKEFDKQHYDKAISIFKKTLKLVPNPKMDWEAGEWLYASIGDAYFFKNEYSLAIDYFRELYDGWGIINEFVLIRYGECLFETGEIERGKKLIFEAYMLGGKEIFICENEKYFELIPQELL